MHQFPAYHLAFVYSKTSVIIAERQAKEAMKAMAVVLAGGDGFRDRFQQTSLSLAAGELQGHFGGIPRKLADGYVGAVVKVESSGYGGTIVMLIGMDSFGVCQGMQIISQSETPGLGAIVKEEAFYGSVRRQAGALATEESRAETSTECRVPPYHPRRRWTGSTRPRFRHDPPWAVGGVEDERNQGVQ